MQPTSRPRERVVPLLRRVITGAFKTSADYDACMDNYFSDVRARFGTGMDRVSQTNLLLETKDPEAVLLGLAKSHPAEFFGAVAMLKSDEQSTLISLFAEQTGDPTQPLPVSLPQGTDAPFDGEQVQGWIQLMLAEHLLVLSSCDLSSLRDCPRLLAASPSLQGVALRRLDLENHLDFPLALDWLAAMVQPTSQTYAGGVLIVIEAFDPQRVMTKMFLGCCHQTLERHSTRTELRAQLQSRRCFILILAHDGAEASGRARPRIPPPFLQRFSGVAAVLRRKGAKSERALELARRITARIGSSAGTEEGLCEWINSQPSLAALEETLNQAEQTGIAPQLKHACADLAAALVDSEDPLRQVVLYVAAFLPGLSLDDFQHAVLALLDERRLDVTALPATATQPATAPLLRDLWPTRRSQILRDCRLRQAPAEAGGERCLQFSEPSLEAAVRQALEEHDPWRHDDTLNLIRLTALLFRGSRRLGQRVIDLVITRLAAEPDRIDVDWLLGLLRHVGPQVPDLEPKDAQQEMIIRVLRENRRLVLERLTGLLAALQVQCAFRPK